MPAITSVAEPNREIDLLRSQIQARRKQFEDADSVIDTIDRSNEADRRIRVLYKLSHKLSSILDLRRLCEKVVDETLELFKADRAIVMLTDEDGKKLKHMSARSREEGKKLTAMDGVRALTTLLRFRAWKQGPPPR